MNSIYTNTQDTGVFAIHHTEPRGAHACSIIMLLHHCLSDLMVDTVLRRVRCYGEYGVIMNAMKYYGLNDGETCTMVNSCCCCCCC